jgi:hypothetical protein
MIRASGSPLLDHIWGISPGADRVWAQIAGIAPSTQPWERWFVALQAYIDDSYTQGGVFVLAGYIATAEAWAEFSKEWDELLPLAKLGPNDRRRFKMQEMIAPAWIQNVPAFYRVIENHVALAVSIKIEIDDITRAMDRVWIEGQPIVWGKWANPTFLVVDMLMQGLHTARIKKSKELGNLLPPDVPIDFYFDESTSQRDILEAWQGFLDIYHIVDRETYGATPRFENDEKFLPLQAADFWAWWTRKAYEENRESDIIHEQDFGSWRRTKFIPTLRLEISEDQLVYHFISTLRHKGAPMNVPIFDAKVHPRPDAAPANLQSNQRLACKIWRWIRG